MIAQAALRDTRAGIRECHAEPLENLPGRKAEDSKALVARRGPAKHLDAGPGHAQDPGEVTFQGLVGRPIHGRCGDPDLEGVALDALDDACLRARPCEDGKEGVGAVGPDEGWQGRRSGRGR